MECTNKLGLGIFFCKPKQLFWLGEEGNSYKLFTIFSQLYVYQTLQQKSFCTKYCWPLFPVTVYLKMPWLLFRHLYKYWFIDRKCRCPILHWYTAVTCTNLASDGWPIHITGMTALWNQNENSIHVSCEQGTAARQSEMLYMMLDIYLAFHRDSSSAGILNTTNSNYI